MSTLSGVPKGEGVQITVDLSKSEAMALANFCRRLDRDPDAIRRHAADSREEGLIYSAFGWLRSALAREGFDPR